MTTSNPFVTRYSFRSCGANADVARGCDVERAMYAAWDLNVHGWWDRVRADGVTPVRGMGLVSQDGMGRTLSGAIFAYFHKHCRDYTPRVDGRYILCVGLRRGGWYANRLLDADRCFSSLNVRLSWRATRAPLVLCLPPAVAFA